MPSVLTDKGYVVFETQEEADAFRAEMEAKAVKRGLDAMEGETVEILSREPELPIEKEMTQEEADAAKREKGDEGFIKNLKRKIGRRN